MGMNEEELKKNTVLSEYVVKVRRDQKPGDYRDPGWFAQPPGTQAYEWTGTLPPAASAPSTAPAAPAPADPAKAAKAATPSTTVNVRKPGAGGHAHH